MITKNKINVLSEIIKGSDESSAISLLKGLTSQEKFDILRLGLRNLMGGDTSTSEHIWKLCYHRKPPSPMEFLSEKWLGPNLNKALFPYWREHFPKVFSRQEVHNELILYGAIGRGKSLFSALCSVYSMVRLWCMHDPYTFYGNAPVNPYVFYLASFTESKTKQIVLKPIIEILSASPMFQQVKYEYQLTSRQSYEDGAPIVWTTASIMGSISLSRNLHYVIGTSVGSQLGLTVFGGAMSELTYFREKAGITYDQAYRFYQALRRRIFSRFSRAYGSLLILDSSSNDLENPLEKYIREEAPNDPRVYISSETHYEARPHLYPVWQKTGETFKVFPGAEGREPFIVTDENKESLGDNDPVLSVPIDIIKDFEKDVYQALRDICGVPSGSKRKFFPNKDFIEAIFNSHYPAIPLLIAPVTSSPSGLLFNQIIEKAPKLCYKDLAGKYMLKRAPTAPRAIHFDLATSETGDSAGVAVCHYELGTDGLPITVFDMAFPVIGGREQTNLASFEHLVYDLKEKMNIPILYISADGFQSAQLLQNLQRRYKNILIRTSKVNSKMKPPVQRGSMSIKIISVDKKKEPYLLLKTSIFRGAIKCYKSKYLQSNLLSLEDLPEKIDHSEGSSRDAEGHYTGKNAKDVSDAVAGAYFHLQQHQTSSSYKFSDCERDIRSEKLKAFKLKFKNGKEAENFKKAQYEEAKKKAQEAVDGGRAGKWWKDSRNYVLVK